MADKTVHALTDGATPADTDEFYVARSPFSTGDDRKLTYAEVKAAILTAGAADFQAVDADLTAIAGLDSSTAGMIASDGAGWIKKTYDESKQALGLALNAADYGVTFDGVTEDTAAWQAVFNAMVANQGGMIVGIPPTGSTTGLYPTGYATSLINGTITVPSGAFWKLYAPGLTWKQQADNTPHLTVTNGGNTTVATQGVLSGTGAGTFTVASAAGFPTSGDFTITIGTEQLIVTGGQGTTTWTVTRGANGTTPASHTVGAAITSYSRSSSGWVIEGPMWFTWANQQATTVATQGCLSGTGTGTFTVANSGPFPSGAITVLIDKERVDGSFSGNTFTVTARHSGPSTAVSHSNGATVYPLGMTNACAIFIQGDATHPFYANFVIEKVAFSKGSYLLGCDQNVHNNTWGYTLRDIYVHNDAVGGVVSNADSAGGQPNNKIENCYVIASSMVGPIFDFTGAQSCWVTGIEINNSWLSPVIINSGGGSSVTIGTLKSELGVYDNRNSGTMFAVVNELFEARYIKLQGMNVDTTNMPAPCVFSRVGGTSGKHIHIDILDFEGDFFASTTDPSGQAFNGWTIANGNYNVTTANTGSGTGIVRIGYMRGLPKNMYLSDTTLGGAQDAVYLTDSNLGRVSVDQANSDYTWDPLGQSAQCLLKNPTGSGNVSAGDTVVITGVQGLNRTFTFQSALAAAGDVKIGADFAATLTNLGHAVNGDGTPGTHYFAGTFSLPFVTAAAVVGSGATATMTFSVSPGIKGNAYTVSSTGTKLQFRNAADTSNASAFAGGSEPENVICYDSTLTGDRTVTLPTLSTATPSNLFNGVKVRVVHDAATAGAHNLVVAPTGGTSKTLASTNGAIEFTFRRGAWVLTDLVTWT